MEILLDQIVAWFAKGRKVALATVIKTWGSSPRPAGAMMAITDQGEISGSVSGGCVESAVIDAAQEVLKQGKARRLHFGVANDEAWEVGLSCGGEIEVFVREFTNQRLENWRSAMHRQERFCITMPVKGDQQLLGSDWCVFQGGEVHEHLSSTEIPSLLRQVGAEAANEGKTALVRFDSNLISEAFLQVVDLPRRMVLVGGVHIAIPLAELANTLGFEVIVVDPRRLFSTLDRFPAVKKLLPSWPREAFQELTITDSTAIVMLTHDPKIDDPAIKIALASPAFYLGALGSKKTHQKRLKRLTEQGIDPLQLNRIHAPVGLDLGSSTPEEIALAILAEIIQVWHQKD